MSKAKKWFMEIRPFTEDENDPGFRRLAASGEHEAQSMASGARINLNPERYYTIVKSEDA